MSTLGLKSHHSATTEKTRTGGISFGALQGCSDVLGDWGKSKAWSAYKKLRNTPQPALLNPWQWPEEPWVKVHIDFAGPLEEHMFLVLLDAHSKWPEVEVMKSTSSVKRVKAFRLICWRFGLPQQLVSDNGAQLVLEEFEVFMKSNGI